MQSLDVSAVFGTLASILQIRPNSSIYENALELTHDLLSMSYSCPYLSSHLLILKKYVQVTTRIGEICCYILLLI